MARHLAIFTPDAVLKINSGQKKIDGRFSKIKISPFGKVASGDQILMKISGRKIVGQFVVDRIIYWDHPNDSDIELIRKKYSRDLGISKTFWLDREKINYVTLMFIKSVTKFLVPPEIEKKDLRPWVVLD